MSEPAVLYRAEAGVATMVTDVVAELATRLPAPFVHGAPVFGAESEAAAGA